MALIPNSPSEVWGICTNDINIVVAASDNAARIQLIRTDHHQSSFIIF